MYKTGLDIKKIDEVIVAGKQLGFDKISDELSSPK